MALDLDKPIRLKQSHKLARIICRDIKSKRGFNFVVAMEFEDHEHEEYCVKYTLEELKNAFENVPEEKVYETWVNIYSDHSINHKSKENADYSTSKDRLACIHVRQTYKDGEGL
jgi:predicted transcriptional regulator YdeE